MWGEGKSAWWLSRARELEMVEKGSPAVDHTGICILDMEKVCRTLYRSGCVKDFLARVGWESQGRGRTL